MLNSAFDRLEDVSPLDFYPAPLRGEIDELNARIYETVNKASIAPALRLPSRLTKKRSGRCSARWTGWTGACPGGVT